MKPAFRPFGLALFFALASASISAEPLRVNAFDYDRPDLSPDGEHIMFTGAASTYFAGGDGNINTIVWERSTNTFRAVSESPSVRGVAPAVSAIAFSADLRHLAYRVSWWEALRLNGIGVENAPGGFLLALTDRDPDADGVLDEPGALSTLVLPHSGDRLPTGFGGYTRSIYPPQISDDGRFVVFVVGIQDNGWTLTLRVLDRDSDADGVLDEPDAVRTADLGYVTEGFHLSRDGSRLTYPRQTACGAPAAGTICVFETAPWAARTLTVPFGEVAAISADGDTLLLNGSLPDGNGGRVTSNYLYDLETGAAEDLGPELRAGNLPAGSGSARAIAVTPDGQFVIATAAGTSGAQDSGGFPLEGRAFLLDRELGTRTMFQMFETNGSFKTVEFGPHSLSDDGRWSLGRGPVLFTPRFDDVRVVVGDAGEADFTGRNWRYPVSVQNAGANPAEGVILRVISPSGATPNPGGSFSGKPCTNEFSMMFRCPIGTIAAGATLTGTFEFSPTASTLSHQVLGMLETSGTVSSYILSRDTGSGQYTNDLAMTKVAMKAVDPPARRGKPVKVSFTVSNLSKIARLSPTIRFAFDKPISASNIVLAEKACTLVNGTTIDCSISELYAGFSVSKFFKVKPLSSGPFTVRMSLKPASSSSIDRNAANDLATATITVR